MTELMPGLPPPTIERRIHGLEEIREAARWTSRLSPDQWSLGEWERWYLLQLLACRAQVIEQLSAELRAVQEASGALETQRDAMGQALASLVLSIRLTGGASGEALAAAEELLGIDREEPQPEEVG